MSYSSEVLADSPLLYVRFEETSGATCANSGSLGGNATAVGTFTRNIAGAVTLGITLGGTASDGVTYPDTASLDITGNVTYECWCKVSAFAADQYLISKGFDSGSVAGYALYIGTSRDIEVYRASIANLASGGANSYPNDGLWHHVAFTRSGGLYTIYVDGAVVGTPNTPGETIQATSQVLSIGRRVEVGSFGRPLVGSIDEVAVYNTALSAARILAHYNAAAAPTSAPVTDFTGTPLSGTASLSVAFTDTSTNTPTSWAWDFGDGSTSTSQNPTHSYTSSGVYTVVLVATNAIGSNTKTRTGYVTVTEPVVYAAGGGIDIR